MWHLVICHPCDNPCDYVASCDLSSMLLMGAHVWFEGQNSSSFAMVGPAPKGDAKLMNKVKAMGSGKGVEQLQSELIMLVYMTDGKVTKFIIDKNEKVIGTEGVNELLLDGKAHGPSWLIGRCVKSDKCSTSGTTNSQISDLTTNIKQEVVDEMEEKLKKKVQDEVDAQVNKKVQENLTWVLKKLGEVNPSMNINLVELCPTISSNNNGTPITGGDATS
ncbi:hypothetical protein OROHE_021553 [Orobanche hederae]